ncbi:DUF6782 family putative metallopeptidase [Paenibacillus sp. FSL K6-1122]|uniref:DUF6782 family putative metallopeptidase n=1 Tax=Paenibacillus sp. FSL K6-1122 TaxID=2954512 RepID=UPI0030EF0953
MIKATNKEDNVFKKFEEHTALMKNILNVNPTVLVGEDAKKYLDERGYRLLNGGFDKNTNTVVVKKAKRLLTLAHEMRHAWQFENSVKYNFEFPEGRQMIYFFRRKEWDANYYAFKYGWNSDMKLNAVIYFLGSVNFLGMWVIVFALLIFKIVI